MNALNTRWNKLPGTEMTNKSHGECVNTTESRRNISQILLITIHMTNQYCEEIDYIQTAENGQISIDIRSAKFRPKENHHWDAISDQTDEKQSHAEVNIDRRYRSFRREYRRSIEAFDRFTKWMIDTEERRIGQRFHITQKIRTGNRVRRIEWTPADFEVISSA